MKTNEGKAEDKGLEGRRKERNAKYKARGRGG